VLPAGQGEVLTEQSFVAEAVPAPMKAIAAIAASRQRPRIFAFLMLSPLFGPAWPGLATDLRRDVPETRSFLKFS
jgi:hypothetical protein